MQSASWEEPASKAQKHEISAEFAQVDEVLKDQRFEKLDHRSVPPIRYGPGNWKLLEQAVEGQPQGTPELAQVLAWLFLCGVDRQKTFRSISAEPMTWGPQNPYVRVQYPDFGKTWRLVLNNPLPEIPKMCKETKTMTNDGRISVTQDGKKGAYVATPCIHCSSWCSALKILKQGLVTGEATKSGLEGVYCYPMYTQKPKEASRQSHRYCLYSNLFQNKVWWGIKHELQVMDGYPCSERKAGDFQWFFPVHRNDAMRPWFHVTAIWIHACTLEEMAQQDILAEEKIFKEYELQPDALSHCELGVER